VLSIFNKVEMFVDFLHNQKKFKITFKDEHLDHLLELEAKIGEFGLKSKRLSITKFQNKLHTVIEISGRRRLLSDFNLYLIELNVIEEVIIV
jgi:hypothetical protein